MAPTRPHRFRGLTHKVGLDGALGFLLLEVEIWLEIAQELRHWPCLVLTLGMEVVPSITGEGGKSHRKGLPTGLGTGTIRFRNGLS